MSSQKVSQEDAVRGTISLLEEATKGVRVGGEEALSSFLGANKTGDSLTQKINDIIKRRSIEVAAASILISSSSIPGADEFSKMVFGVAASSRVVMRIHRRMIIDIGAVFEEEIGHERAKEILLEVGNAEAEAREEEEKFSKEMSRKLLRSAMAQAMPHAAFAKASMNMMTTFVIGKRARAYFETGPASLAPWSEDVKALTGLDQKMLVEWEDEALTMLLNDVGPRLKSGGLKAILNTMNSDVGQKIVNSPVGKGLAKGGEMMVEGGKALAKTEVAQKVTAAAVEGGKALVKNPRVQAAVSATVKGAAALNKKMKDA